MFELGSSMSLSTAEAKLVKKFLKPITNIMKTEFKYTFPNSNINPNFQFKLSDYCNWVLNHGKLRSWEAVPLSRYMLHAVWMQHIFIIGPGHVGWLQSSLARRYLPRFALGQKQQEQACSCWQQKPLSGDPYDFAVVHLPVRWGASCADISFSSSCRPCRLVSSCICWVSCSLHIRHTRCQSSRFFRNALRISFARNTVTKGCWRQRTGVWANIPLSFFVLLPFMCEWVCVRAVENFNARLCKCLATSSKCKLTPPSKLRTDLSQGSSYCNWPRTSRTFLWQSLKLM